MTSLMILKLFGPADHKKKKNCLKNPWCLFGLGEYKEGVWSKTFKESIPDMTEGLRKKTHGMVSPPCGLKNLGATCYLNVLVQVTQNDQLVSVC